MSVTTEDERSQPPTPDGTGLPVNFHQIGPGIYRSSYPQAAHFERLKLFGFKTVVTLVADRAPDKANEIFMSKHNITHRVIPCPGKTKDLEHACPYSVMHEIISLLLDRQNHPMLVHCNKGKHRTGCVVACFRKVTGWTDDAAVAEYERHAAPKDRHLDKAYISAFDPCLLKATALENGFVGGAFSQADTYLDTSCESAYTVNTTASDLSSTVSIDGGTNPEEDNEVNREKKRGYVVMLDPHEKFSGSLPFT